MKFIKFEDKLYNLDQLKYMGFGDFDMILCFEDASIKNETNFYLASQVPTPYFGHIFQEIIWFIDGDEILYELKDKD